MSPPGYSKVLGLGWDLHQEEGFQSWGLWGREGRWDVGAAAAGRVLSVQDHWGGLVVAARSCRAGVGCGAMVGGQWSIGAGVAAKGLWEQIQEHM